MTAKTELGQTPPNESVEPSPFTPLLSFPAQSEQEKPFQVVKLGGRTPGTDFYHSLLNDRRKGRVA
jgi:hypothetical protein